MNRLEHAHILAWEYKTGFRPPKPYSLSRLNLPLNCGVRDDAGNINLDMHGIVRFRPPQSALDNNQIVDAGKLVITIHDNQVIPRGNALAPDLLVETIPAGPIETVDHGWLTPGVECGRAPWPGKVANGTEIAVQLTGLARTDFPTELALRVRASTFAPGVYSFVAHAVRIDNPVYVPQSPAGEANERLARALEIQKLLPHLSVSDILLLMELLA